MTVQEYLDLFRTLPKEAQILDCLYAIEEAMIDAEMRDIVDSTEIIDDIYERGYYTSPEDDIETQPLILKAPNYDEVKKDHIPFYQEDFDLPIPN